MNSISQSSASSQRSWIPYWLALLPALAVIAGFVTLYLAMRYPDQALQVEKVSEIHDEQGVHQHVTNSVTPPLR